jgi:hypothetical protein
MTTRDWEALGVQTFGLPEDLFVPIAAADVEVIEAHVGLIETRVTGRRQKTNAVVVVADRPKRNPTVPLWELPDADQYYERLHPKRQLWVHVDYGGYRRTWRTLGLGTLESDVVLDHVQNRAAVRLRDYRHPFVRLCPISRETNTSGGLDNGTEGMEKEQWRRLGQQSTRVRARMLDAAEAPVVLADPIDLTKMLDIPPGLTELPGVAAMLMKYYAREEPGSVQATQSS